MAVPRGIRSNNPGNLREAKGDTTRWVGERATDDDPEFEEFERPEFGLRALALVLLNYQRKHGLRSVEQIINRWAPPNENHTEAYVKAVAGALGVNPGQPLNLSQEPILRSLTQAIVRHENGPGPLPGGEWYHDETYRAALRLVMMHEAAHE